MSVWYTDSVKYTAVTAWAASTSIAAGALRRQLTTPAVGNERVFAAVVAGTTNSSEPTWVVTKGALTTDSGVTWQEVTGQPGVNGDIANTPSWASIKNTAVALGLIIKDAAGTHLFTVTTAGTAGNGSEPTWGTTAGNTTTDNTVTWTCLGLASAFGAFAAPFSRLANAFTATWGAAGDDFYLGHQHSATTSANLNLQLPGTAAAPNRVLCITNTNVSSPSLTTGAQEQTTSVATLRMGGIGYVYGLTIDFASTFVQALMNNTTNAIRFDTCTFKQSGTANGAAIIFGGGATPSGSLTDLDNCTFTFGQSGNFIGNQFGLVRFKNCSFAQTGTVPAFLFFPQTGSTTIFRDCDLSKFTSLVSGFSTYWTVDILNCKINASTTVLASAIASQGSGKVRLHNCDSGASNYKITEVDYNGTVTQETATVRTSTGGATDGTTPQSVKAVTSANSSFIFPLEIPLLPKWNNTSGSSVTATVEIAGGATLTDGDIWLELEYPGSASSPQGSSVSTRTASIIGTPANLPSSSETWGGSPTSKQKLSVSFTPQMLGPIFGRVRVAKKSTTVYIDPIITLT